MLKHMFLHLGIGTLRFPLKYFVGMSMVEIYAVLVGGGIILFVDICCETGKWQEIKGNCPMILRNLAFTFLLFSIILVAGGDNGLMGGFMYANF